MESNNSTLEVLTDLMPTEWRRYTLWMHLKEHYEMVKTQHTELEEQKAHSVRTLSLCPKVSRKLDSLSTTLRRFARALDVMD